jgi:hypothetical protein
LALSAAGSVAIGMLGAVTIINWWNVAPSAPYKSLHKDEAKTLRYIAGAAFPSGDNIPLNGADANLDRFFDELLSNMSDENRKLLKLLIQAIEKLPILNHFQSFSNLSDIEQIELVTTLFNDDNHLVRGAIQSLVVLLGMGYTSHPTASVIISDYFQCGFGR